MEQVKLDIDELTIVYYSIGEVAEMFKRVGNILVFKGSGVWPFERKVLKN